MTQDPIPAVPGVHQRDKELANAVARKDRKATAEFVEQHADAVYGYILARLKPNTADVDDLAQDVFLAAYQSIREYRGASPLKAWLFGIARHKVEDYYRARLRDFDVGGADHVVAADLQLDSALDERRRRDRTLAAMERLPEQVRLLLQWRYWDHKATAEIAEILGRTPKAVERMLARAREHFRREWEARV